MAAIPRESETGGLTGGFAGHSDPYSKFKPTRATQQDPVSKKKERHGGEGKKK